jgi:hypothetical protein
MRKRNRDHIKTPMSPLSSKTRTRLSLRRETVQRLSSTQLQGIAGGGVERVVPCTVPATQKPSSEC